MTTGPREVPQPNQGWFNRIWLVLITLLPILSGFGSSILTLFTRAGIPWAQNKKNAVSTDECKRLHLYQDNLTRTGLHKEQPLDSEIQNKPTSIEQTESREIAVDNFYKKCVEEKTGERGVEGAA